MLVPAVGEVMALVPSVVGEEAPEPPVNLTLSTMTAPWNTSSMEYWFAYLCDICTLRNEPLRFEAQMAVVYDLSAG